MNFDDCLDQSGSKFGASLIKTGLFLMKGKSIPVAGNGTLKWSAVRLTFLGFFLISIVCRGDFFIFFISISSRCKGSGNLLNAHVLSESAAVVDGDYT